jgi:hypothetical protein
MADLDVKENLTIEETNKIRVNLGLKPLRVSQAKIDEEKEALRVKEEQERKEKERQAEEQERKNDESDRFIIELLFNLVMIRKREEVKRRALYEEGLRLSKDLEASASMSDWAKQFRERSNVPVSESKSTDLKEQKKPKGFF